MSNNTKKNLVVGLDAACWEYLDPLLEGGRLPTLQRLMDTGTWGTLSSTLPALTPAAWASIITGKNPGKHGIFDHLWRRPGAYESLPVNARLRRGTPFWQRLNEQNVRVGLVNIPFTHPPDPVEGFVVGGFGTPDSVPDVTYPQDLLGWIKERYTTFQPSVDTALLNGGDHLETLEGLKQHQHQQVALAVELAERYQVQVLAINLMLTDHANHHMPDMKQVEEAYCQSDTDLNQLIQGFKPDNIMVISDHGSRRVQGDFMLYAWLRDNGYCVQMDRDPSERSSALNWVLIQWFQKHWGWSGLPEKVLRNLARELIPKLPNQATDPIWQAFESLITFSREYVLLSHLTDYTRTPVFPGTVASGLLYFNLEGREPTGVISPQARDSFSAELADRLAEIVDPATNEPVFFGIYTPDDLYTGIAAEYAPDLILDNYSAQWNAFATYYGPRVGHSRDRYFFDNKRTFGWHSRDGIFVCAGPDFMQGPVRKNGQNVMDIPATLLHLHDVPVPDDFDGRVLTEVMTSEYITQHPIRYQPGDVETEFSYDDLYSEEETEDLMEHLRALGYVE